MPSLTTSFVALAISSTSFQPLPTSFDHVFFRVQSSSMDPSIPTGSLVVVEPLVKHPDRADVIVIKAPNDPGSLHLLKVVGLAGETIEFDDGFPVIDGHKVKNLVPFIPPMSTGWANYPSWNKSYKVPKESLYLLADNHRQMTSDSLMFGAINEKEVIGSASTWESVLKQPGRMHQILERTFSRIRLKIPLDAGDGQTLVAIEINGDTEIVQTYETKNQSEIDSATIKAAMRERLCKSSWVLLATGLKFQYVFLRNISPSRIEVRFNQSECFE